MHIRSISAATLVVAAVIASQAPAASQAKTVICGQIKRGPYAAYTFRLNNKTLRGRTWTVFATGAPCSAAMKAAPAILTWWAKAKVGAADYSANGFACNKEDDGRGRSGSVGCSYSKGPALANIELMMTGSYTIARLKRMFFIA